MDANTVEESPRFSDRAIKVAQIRQAKNKFRRNLGLVSGASLLLAGLVGTPAALAAGTFFSLNFMSGVAAIEQDILKSHAIRHKLRRVAKRVNEMYGTRLSFRCDYTNRTAGFVLCDASGRVPVTGYITSENMHEYLSPEICEFFIDSLDYELLRFNSYRGKGEEAKNAREFQYRNVPKVGLDNVSSAFDDVGGVLSNKELINLSIGSSLVNIEYKKFMSEHKKEELWTFSINLSEYLRDIQGMDVNDKNKLLMEFRHHFEKYGDEGMQQFDKLCTQLEEEHYRNRVFIS